MIAEFSKRIIIFGVKVIVKIRTMYTNRFPFLLIVFTISITKICFSQNYQLINSSRERVYFDEHENTQFVKVIKAEYDGLDSIFYFQQNVDTTNDACLLVDGDIVILGTRMILQPDGTHIFFNNLNDSIKIKTIINVGDNWHVFDFADGSYIKGTVIFKEDKTVMPDTQDTIYRIQLNRFSATGEILTDSFPNATKIDIGQKFGLIEFFNFNQFPLDTMQYYIRGLSTPDTGIVNLNTYRVFDYKLGYEFHYMEKLNEGDEISNSKTTKLYKHFILNKIQYIDSVYYEIFRVEIDYRNQNGLLDTIRYLDTIHTTIIYSDYKYLDSLELTLLEEESFGFSDYIQDDSILSGIENKYVYHLYDYDDLTNCLTSTASDSLSTKLFGSGIGIMQYKDSTDFYNSHQFSMVYFQRGLIQWGIPINFDTLGFVPIPMLDQQISIIVAPNPASQYIEFFGLQEQTSSVLCTITNTFGKTILIQNINSLNSRIDISYLSEGVYFVTLNNNNIVNTHKIVIIH